MTKEQLSEIEGASAPGTPWYVFAVHAFSLVPRLLEERKRLLNEAKASIGCCGSEACRGPKLAAIAFAEEAANP